MPIKLRESFSFYWNFAEFTLIIYIHVNNIHMFLVHQFLKHEIYLFLNHFEIPLENMLFGIGNGDIT